MSNLQVTGQRPCGYFQWFDPPLPVHLKRHLLRFMHRAREAEIERDIAKEKVKKLHLVVVILVLVIFVCILGRI